MDSALRPPPRLTEPPSPPESGVRDRLYRQWEDDDASDGTNTTSLFARGGSIEGKPRLRGLGGIVHGEVFDLEGKDQFLVGRSRDVDVRVDDVGVSRVHCRIVKKRDAYHVEDLGSMNGTKVNGCEVGSAVLRPGDRIELGPKVILQFALQDEAEDTRARRFSEAITRDSLTRAYNRRYFLERLSIEITRARSEKAPLSVLLVNLDRFRAINDSAGHAAGDAVLRAIVDEVAQSVRPDDVVTRYGGEELAILLPASSRTDACRLAERVRFRIEAMRTTHGERTLKVTASIGVAELSECHASAAGDELVALAERRLRRAKLLGRNRVASA